RAAGIRDTTIEAAFAEVELIEKVVSLDRKQPETVQTFQEYMTQRLPQALVDKGKALLNENRALLEEIGTKYGVQPRFIVALWGVETRYGSYTGALRAITALTAPAYDDRRGAYFRGEPPSPPKLLAKGPI